MNSTILNRDFQHPADGWYMIEPQGDHPNRRSNVTQVIDDQAMNDIVKRFNEDAESSMIRKKKRLLMAGCKSSPTVTTASMGRSVGPPPAKTPWTVATIASSPRNMIPAI
jgi:hypothetical protein